VNQVFFLVISPVMVVHNCIYGWPPFVFPIKIQFIANQSEKKKEESGFPIKIQFIIEKEEKKKEESG